MGETDADEQVRREILEIERETMAAIERKDGKALGRVLAEQFVYRTPTGEELGREAFLRNIASIPFEILSVRGENLKVGVFGETVVLTGVQVATVRTEDGKEEVGRGAFTDVFVRREGRWLMALAYDVELPAAAAPPEKEEAK
jgi:ketosteroid isomerase-like protein